MFENLLDQRLRAFLVHSALFAPRFVHILDNNTNVTHVLIGPKTLARQDHEIKVLSFFAKGPPCSLLPFPIECAGFWP